MNNQAITIYVIDDEEILRNCLKDILTDEGYNVKSMIDGEEGLAVFAKQPADIVILDIKMPGMSGVEVLKNIKLLHPSTEVIMITGYATVSTAEESKKLGAFDYLTKPFDMSQIKNVIKKILAEKK